MLTTKQNRKPWDTLVKMWKLYLKVKFHLNWQTKKISSAERTEQYLNQNYFFARIYKKKNA
jgi:hypothetical protein